MFAALALVLTILGSLLAAACTAVLAHRFTSRRDLINRRSELRIQYLLSAYRALANPANRDLESSYNDARAFEDGLADIQLLGSRPQAEMARQIAYSMATKGEASLDELLLSLRDELRGVLGLERLQGNPVHTRFVFSPEGGEAEFPNDQASGQKVTQSLPDSSPVQENQVSS